MREEKGSTKRKLVEAAYQIISEKGLESITAREVSSRIGVSATMIYKHFENLTYLTVIASIRCISDYVGELKIIYYDNMNPIVRTLKGWHNFCIHAFKNPPIYENLFWGDYNTSLEEAIMEFYELFPEELKLKNEAFLIYSLFSSSIEERDFIWLRRAANQNLIAFNDAQFLARTNSLICHSCLLEHMKDYMEPGVSDKAAEECFRLLERNIMKYVIDPDLLNVQEETGLKTN